MDQPTRVPQSPPLHPLTALLLLLSAGCGIIERPDDTGATASDATDYAGEERYVLATSPGEEVDCALSWAAAGTRSSLACAGCTFAFDIEFTFDAAASVDNGACISRSFSFSETYLLVEEGGAQYIARWGGDAPEILGDASFDVASGEFSYSYQDPGYSYGYYYYYAQYTAGTAQVQ